MPQKRGNWARYKLRFRRKRFLWRAFVKRRELSRHSVKVSKIKPADILLFATVRNEMQRLPYFLDHYRSLGIGHFLMVDNNSDDGTTEFLTDNSDVSVWRTKASYKASRFGMDWLTCLQWRFGHNHWTVTVDVDELLIYPDWETRDLHELTAWMGENRLNAMGALMLDLYPKGPIENASCAPGQDPTEVLCWFDPYGYWAQRQFKMDNLWLQGGARARFFFQTEPERAPTLNKIPLMRWDRSYVYVNSTHNALPATLNRVYDEGGIEKPTGVLLHTKFLADATHRAEEEKRRREHFANAESYRDYYDTVAANPDLWHDGAEMYDGWQKLVRLGLMFCGKW